MASYSVRPRSCGSYLSTYIRRTRSRYLLANEFRFTHLAKRDVISICHWHICSTGNVAERMMDHLQNMTTFFLLKPTPPSIIRCAEREACSEMFDDYLLWLYVIFHYFILSCLSAKREMVVILLFFLSCQVIKIQGGDRDAKKSTTVLPPRTFHGCQCVFLCDGPGAVDVNKRATPHDTPKDIIMTSHSNWLQFVYCFACISYALWKFPQKSLQT